MDRKIYPVHRPGYGTVAPTEKAATLNEVLGQVSCLYKHRSAIAHADASSGIGLVGE
jgi:hypothetical protein